MGSEHCCEGCSEYYPFQRVHLTMLDGSEQDCDLCDACISYIQDGEAYGVAAIHLNPPPEVQP